VGLKTSQSYPPQEVIHNKGYVLSDPYQTQGTYKITPASNLCVTKVKKLINHGITDAQENSRKSGPLYGQRSKA
jgi:hypothetical protein